MTDPRVSVVVAAEDEASAEIRRVTDALMKLIKAQTDAAKANDQGAGAARRGANALRDQAQAAQAISARVRLLADGAKNANTASDSLRRLVSVEQQLAKAVQNANLPLEQRIRLSAVHAQATKAIEDATQPATRGVSLFGRAVSGANTALGFFGLAVGAATAASLVRFAFHAVELAGDLNDLAEQTGIAVEQLQALQLIAEQSGLKADGLSAVFGRLSKATEELRQGDTGTVSAFRAIGIDAKELVGLSLDQVLVRIANALDGYADGAGKAYVIQQLLGRSGAEMIPTLKALAGDGLPKARAELEKVGALMSKENVEAADKLGDHLKLLSRSLVGLTARTTLQWFEDISALTRQWGRDLDGVSDRLGVGLENARALWQFLQRTPPAIEQGLRQGEAEARRAQLAGDGLLPKTDPSGAVIMAPVVVRPEIQVADPSKLEAQRKAEQAASVAHADRLAEIAKAGLDRTRALTEAAYQRGAIGLEDYQQQLRDITARANAVELSRLTAHLAAVKARQVDATDPADAVRKQQEIADAQSAIDIARVRGATQILQLDQQRDAQLRATADRQRQEDDAHRTRVLQLQDEERGFEAELAGLRGDTSRQADLAARRTLQSYVAVVTQLRGAIAGAVAFGSAVPLLRAQDGFNAAQLNLQRELQRLEVDREAVRQRAVAAGESERETQQNVLTLERQRQPTLQALADQMLRFAQTLGNPDMVNAARALQVQVAGIGTEVKASDRALREMGDTILNAVGSDLATFLGSTINQVHGVGDAFRQLASSVVSSIQQIIAQMIAMQVVEAGSKILNAGKVDTAFAIGRSVAGAIAGHASGGFITGPGTGTSDSILARLSHGEYVIRAARVRELGVSYLDALNRGAASVRSAPSVSVPRFASGGLVTGGGSSRLHVTVGAAANRDVFRAEVIDVVRTEGADVTLEHLGRNPEAARGMLGT